MGLDQYLYKITYIGGNYEHNGISGTEPILTAFNKPIPIQIKRLVDTKELMGQWRKANAIHKWFVDNVQNGQDDCNAYYVSSEQLKKLKEICEQVLNDHSKAEELLPTTSGFFFGSTDYNEYYFDDIKYTIDILNDCLQEDEKETPAPFHFEYDSSW